jgi:hypothetical protein
MRGEIERSDEGKSPTVAGPVRRGVRTVANGVAAIDRSSLTRIRLDEDGRTIRPSLRSNGRI